MIKRFIKFGEENRWGKRRPAMPLVDVWFCHQQDRLCKIATRLFANLPNVDLDGSNCSQIEVGLDVLGAGGGQWTLVKGKSGKVSCGAGLPSLGHPTLQIEATRLEQLLVKIERMGQLSKGRRWDVLSEQIEAAISLSQA